MKGKALLCGALCVSSFSSVVNAASIYADEGTSLAIGGRVEARAEYRDSDIIDLSRVRVNISGETLIGDGISGIGYFEQEFKASDNKTRYLYAGIKAAVGEGEAQVVYGKTAGAMSLVTDMTDIQAAYGAIAADKFKVGKRIANSIATFYTNDSGTSLGINYSGKHTIKADTFKHGFSIGASQALGDTGLTLATGYADQTMIKKGKEKEKSQFDVGMGYQIKQFYLGALYTNQKLGSKDADGYDVVAAYKINSIYKATLGFGELHVKGGDDTRAVNGDITAKWNKHFRTYAAVNYDTVIDDTQAMLGARYDF
ncbi:porin [Photobacterium leiognathi]|uniref:porin n=1 Tax=Photobacterium leiognathi TaxID=553611 RepID=UPI00076A59EE|nr:porin [Photobacterium leiognathi]